MMIRALRYWLITGLFWASWNYSFAQDAERAAHAHESIRDALVVVEGYGETEEGIPLEVRGTGTVISSDGTVLTAYHVLAPLNDSVDEKRVIKVRVGHKTGAEYIAEPLNVFPTRDVALLRLNSSQSDPIFACLEVPPGSYNEGSWINTSGFPQNIPYVGQTGQIVSLDGPSGTYLARLEADEGQSGSPAYNYLGKIMGIIKGEYQPNPNYSVIVPLRDVINLLPEPPAECGEVEGSLDASGQEALSSPSDGSENPVLAQTWRRTFGGQNSDMFHSIAPTGDGHFVVSGSSGEDGWLVKVDEQGGPIWSRTYSDTDASEEDTGSFRSVVPSRNGGFLVLGTASNVMNVDAEVFGYEDRSIVGDAILMKIDKDGQEEWRRPFVDNGSLMLQAAVTSHTSGYLLAGAMQNGRNGSLEGLLLKLDEQGIDVWTRTFGDGMLADAMSDGFRALVASEDSGYVAAGVTEKAYREDAWLVKIDERGQEIWSNIIAKDTEKIDVLSVSKDGGYLFFGETDSENGGHPLILKVDADGREEWRRVLVGEERIAINSIIPDRDGGYLLAGLIEAENEVDALLLRFNEEGEEEWRRAFGGLGTDIFWSGAPSGDGGYLLAGTTEYRGGSSGDGWLVKVDHEGRLHSDGIMRDLETTSRLGNGSDTDEVGVGSAI